jgi:pyrroloquinoline quinone biosynthesis protein B
MFRVTHWSLERIFILCMLLLAACSAKESKGITEIKGEPSGINFAALVILGTLQDGGSPHIGCTRECCSSLFAQPDPNRMVVSLGIIDPDEGKTFLIEATPDITRQLRLLKNFTGTASTEVPDGILLTHAHIGHYAGLMYLGREALGVSKVPVYAMPRMKAFLEKNGPWQQLVTLNNIVLNELKEDSVMSLTPNIRITPFRVPHRDEYSETVGYRIEGPNKKVLFIPDIDKWEKWEQSIVEEIQRVDYALIDATFYDASEVNNRDIREIPHPFVVESLSLFQSLTPEQKAKVIFIHFNHTNPLLLDSSAATKRVKHAGFNVARTGNIIPL